MDWAEHELTSPPVSSTRLSWVRSVVEPLEFWRLSSKETTLAKEKGHTETLCRLDVLRVSGSFYKSPGVIQTRILSIKKAMPLLRFVDKLETQKLAHRSQVNVNKK